MELYTNAGSPNCRKVKAVINHLDIDVDIKDLDVRAGALRTPEFIALNPNAMIPTLVDGTFTLWESNAIMQYLAQKSGDDKLLPADPRGRADVVRWQCWEQAHFNRAFGTLAFQLVAKPALGRGAPDDQLVAAARSELARFVPVLEFHLGNRQYLVGDSVTLADYSMCTFEYYQDKIGFDWTDAPNLRAYLGRMRARDSWARTYVAPPAPVARDSKAA